MRRALLWVPLLLAGCGEPERTELVVFAASSLTDVVAEAAADFPGAVIVPNLAGSMELAMQIRRGARADLLLCAAPGPARRVDPEAARFAGNRLVAVTCREDYRGLDAASRIAIGEPDSVPAGIYAKRALETLGTWERLQDRLVPSSNVRVVLAHVESGAADVGLVYRTDAALTDRVRIVETFDVEVEYYAVVLGKDELAARFLKHLQPVLQRHGFSP